MIVADSQAPINWLATIMPWVGLGVLIFAVVMIIAGKFWIFPSPAKRQARNRRKCRRRSSSY